jgi:hypothetical protein
MLDNDRVEREIDFRDLPIPFYITVKGKLTWRYAEALAEPDRLSSLPARTALRVLGRAWLDRDDYLEVFGD